VLPSSPGAATGTQPAPAPDGGGIAGDIQRAAADAQRAIVDAANAAAQAAQTGQAGTTVPPPYRDTGIPDEVIPLVGMSLGLVVAMVVGYPIARAIGRVIQRRGEAGLVKAADVAPQLRQLQASVDTMAIEIERISEAQRFTAKLLADRAPALPGGEGGSA